MQYHVIALPHRSRVYRRSLTSALFLWASGLAFFPNRNRKARMLQSQSLHEARSEHAEGTRTAGQNKVSLFQSTLMLR